MKCSKLFFTALLLLSSLTVQAGKIYTWTDENGKTHFSDTPIQGASSEVDVDPQNLISAEVLETKEKSTDSLSEQLTTKVAPEAINYQADIVFPKDDSTIRSNEGTLEIHVNITPQKESGHMFQLYLDGQKLGKPQYSPTMRALNVDRGTHQVQVQLLDEKGKVLAKTQIVTVHLQRVAAGG